MSVVYLDREAFIAKYADNDPDRMAVIRTELRRLEETFKPTGWVMLQRQEITALPGAGQLSIVTFGPRNTWKEIPEGLVSPTGSTRDISAVVAVCLVESQVLSVT